MIVGGPVRILAGHGERAGIERGVIDDEAERAVIAAVPAAIIADDAALDSGAGAAVHHIRIGGVLVGIGGRESVLLLGRRGGGRSGQIGALESACGVDAAAAFFLSLDFLSAAFLLWPAAAPSAKRGRPAGAQRARRPPSSPPGEAISSPTSRRERPERCRSP